MPPLLFIREVKSLLSTTVFQGVLDCCDIGRTEVQKGSVLRIMEEGALWRLDRGSTESQEYVGQKNFEKIVAF